MESDKNTATVPGWTHVTWSRHLVPALHEFRTPVRRLKEGFTLSGEPLPISTCMKKLGFEITKAEDGIACEAVEDKQVTLFFRTPDGTWECGHYHIDAEGCETRATSKKDVLIALILRYYQTHSDDCEVIASLSARLVPLATQPELDTLRNEIKSLR